jgi:hypothetical protein
MPPGKETQSAVTGGKKSTSANGSRLVIAIDTRDFDAISAGAQTSFILT